ncbi:MAG: hypothetical protein HEEMFOPI_01165 [Holosporales bacterium]
MDADKSLICTMIQKRKNLKNPVKKKMRILQKKSGLNGYDVFTSFKEGINAFTQSSTNGYVCIDIQK